MAEAIDQQGQFRESLPLIILVVMAAAVALVFAVGANALGTGGDRNDKVRADTSSIGAR